VICGHIHVPRIQYFGDVLYCNTGDWVEHCTALAELENGELELLEWSNGPMTPVMGRTMTRLRSVAESCYEPATDNIAATVMNQMLRRWQGRLASAASACVSMAR